jgi:CubicO group peptidase (beta-lactamase class C family)
MKQTIRTTLVLLALLVCTAAATSRAATHALGDKLRALLDADVPKLLADKHVTSVSIAHIEHANIVLVAAYGSQSPGVPATPKTLYNIASMSKPISAEVLMRLVAAGRVSLDEPMYKYWVDPDIANDERNKLLTPRISLTHRTGFPNWRRQTDKVLKFQHDPGQVYGYSGEGFEYLARFAEKKTGTPFERLAQTLVFDPIGMHDTAYTKRAWFAGRVALPTDAKGTALEPAFAQPFFASDLVYSTAGDYAKFLVSLMKREAVGDALANERAKIQVSRKDEICTPALRADCPDDVGFGLGWEVYRFGDEAILMHTGNDDGVFTFGYFNPKSGSGTVIFTNSANGPQIVLPILERIGDDPAFVKLLRRMTE